MSASFGEELGRKNEKEKKMGRGKMESGRRKREEVADEASAMSTERGKNVACSKFFLAGSRDKKWKKKERE